MKSTFGSNEIVNVLVAEPARRWRQDAAVNGVDIKLRLRLAAMAGHMTTDRVAARRAALIDLLADGRPHTGDSIRQTIAHEVGGDDCWGKRPQETLLRDLKALRRSGLRVAYSRSAGLEGYYLEYPPLEDAATARFQGGDGDTWIKRLQTMSIPEKQAAA